MLRPDSPHHLDPRDKRIAELEARVSKLENALMAVKAHSSEAVTKMRGLLQKQDAIIENMRRAVVTESK